MVQQNWVTESCFHTSYYWSLRVLCSSPFFIMLCQSQPSSFIHMRIFKFLFSLKNNGGRNKVSTKPLNNVWSHYPPTLFQVIPSIKAGNQRARHFFCYIFMRSIPGPDQTIDQSLRGTSWFRDMFLSTGHRSWVLMRRWCCHLISLLAGGSVGHNHWIWQMDTMFIRSPQVPTFTLPANHSLHSPRRRYYLPTGMCSWRINWFLHRCRAFYRPPPHPFNVCCLLCVPFPRGASNNAIRVTHIGSVN